MGFADFPTPGPAPWPGYLSDPAVLLKWLHAQHVRLAGAGDATALRHLATLRWLVLAEADRTAPEPPERGPPAAWPDLPAAAAFKIVENSGVSVVGGASGPENKDCE